ncbi:MAG: hypothetical protein J5594_00860 [Elusimicrobiaceae bacterium]|nr:hypothetical protein [Elusimicrobiaceae bacterium]
MSENNFESKKSSKEIWLILIFVDIIALCVFSYLIYNSFTNSNKKTIQISRNPKTEEMVLEEIDLSKPTGQEPKKEEVKEAKKESVQELEKEIKKEVTAEVKTQIEEEKVLPKKEPKEVNTVNSDVKKESVKISGSGKWRQVTFKYFDTAKSVAIVSGFTSTKPRDLKKVNGVWEITLTISPGTYRYMFIVDGKEVKDPYNKKESNGRSVIDIK